MAKKDDETLLETEDQEAVVVITDEKGNETYYLEEMVIPMDSKNFALLTRSRKMTIRIRTMRTM